MNKAWNHFLKMMAFIIIPASFSPLAHSMNVAGSSNYSPSHVIRRAAASKFKQLFKNPHVRKAALGSCAIIAAGLVVSCYKFGVINTIKAPFVFVGRCVASLWHLVRGSDSNEEENPDPGRGNPPPGGGNDPHKKLVDEETKLKAEVKKNWDTQYNTLKDQYGCSILKENEASLLNYKKKQEFDGITCKLEWQNDYQGAINHLKTASTAIPAAMTELTQFFAQVKIQEDAEKKQREREGKIDPCKVEALKEWGEFREKTKKRIEIFEKSLTSMSNECWGPKLELSTLLRNISSDINQASNAFFDKGKSLEPLDDTQPAITHFKSATTIIAQKKLEIDPKLADLEPWGTRPTIIQEINALWEELLDECKSSYMSSQLYSKRRVQFLDQVSNYRKELHYRSWYRYLESTPETIAQLRTSVQAIKQIEQSCK